MLTGPSTSERTLRVYQGAPGEGVEEICRGAWCGKDSHATRAQRGDDMPPDKAVRAVTRTDSIS